MRIQHFFDSETSSLTYVVFDENSRDAVVIDSTGIHELVFFHEQSEALDT